VSGVGVGRLLSAYLITGVLFVAVDLLWLGVVARAFYRRHLGHLLRADPGWWAAGVFYVVFLAGVFAFAVLPAAERSSELYALGAGALLGLVAYATYDLVNLATLEGWPTIVAVVDVAWGTAFVSAASWAGYRILRWLG